MGIGNTTTATAVACALLNRGPNELTGRGAGLSDAGLDRKIRTIEASLKRNNPDPADIVDVLSKVGGLDIAAMCGTFLGRGFPCASCYRRLHQCGGGVVRCAHGSMPKLQCWPATVQRNLWPAL